MMRLHRTFNITSSPVKPIQARNFTIKPQGRLSARNWNPLNKASIISPYRDANLRTSFDNLLIPIQRRWYQQQPEQEPEHEVVVYELSWRHVLSPILFSLAAGVGILLLSQSDFAEENKKRREKRIYERIMQGKSSDNTFVRAFQRLSEGERTISAIVALNTLVFGAWNIPGKHQIFLNRYFTHSIISPSVLSIIGSVFSHSSFSHLFFNMFGLYTFGEGVHGILGREQFLGMYLAGGIFSSMGSHIFKLIRLDAITSLGASGAVFTVIAASAYYDPNKILHLIFLPMVTFTKEKLFYFAVLFDTVGLVGSMFGKHWLRLDHAAHLSGAAFGWLYVNYGNPKLRRKPPRAYIHQRRS